MITYVRLSLAVAAVLLAGCGGGGTSFPQSSIHAASPAAPSPSPSAPLAVSGTIAGVMPNSINLNGGSNCGYVNVSYDSSTSIATNGNSLVPGVYAKVYGSGSCATSFSASAIALSNAPSGTTPSPTPSQSAISSTIAQTHVLTADYLGGFAGTHAVSASQAASVLSWAEVSIQDANSTSGAGIKTMEYIDPFEQASSDALYSSGAFAHDCSGNLIVPSYNSSQVLMDPGSSTLSSALDNWQSAQELQGHIDAFFYDNTDDTWGLPALPCGVTTSSWDSENSSLIGASNYPVIFNGYGMNSDSISLLGNSAVLGGMLEDAYGQRADPGPTAPYTTGTDWINNENLQLNAANMGKLFFCYNTPTTDASSSIQLRQYIYASFLMGYAPSSSVLWEYFSTPSGLHVFPETQLVPTNPLISSASSVSSFAQGSLYVREYTACYLNGSSIGHCAAVVNPSSGSSYSMPSLSQSYSHTMSISGYGTLDGGSVSASGPPPPSSLSPETGVVLIQ